VVLPINDFIMLFGDLAMACCGPNTVSDVKLAVTRIMVKNTKKYREKYGEIKPNITPYFSHFLEIR